MDHCLPHPIMGAINQMERELKAQRAAAGRSAARARGKTGGRPKTDSKLLGKARILYEGSDYTAAEVCKTFGIGRRTFFKHLDEMRQAEFEAKEDEKRNPPKVVSDDF